MARDRAPAGPAAEESVPNDAAVAAFFDVDNTLVRGASIFHIARGMAARGMMPWPAMAEAITRQARFVLSGSEHPADLARAASVALAFVRGRSTEEIRELGETLFDPYLRTRIWPGTLARAHEHLAAGHEVWLVSATPQELAEVIALRLGLTGGIGTRADTVEGIYTGELTSGPLHGALKAVAIGELAQERGISLAASYAYSDSGNDLPMLTAVGHPHAINPDPELRAHAQRAGWQITDYRGERMRQRARVAGTAAVVAVAVGATAGAVVHARRAG